MCAAAHDCFGPAPARAPDDCKGERLSEYAQRAAIRRLTFPRKRAVGAACCQAVFAIQWLWSFRMLWVAATSRHSDCAAALPLRMNRSMRRLCLICP